MEHGGHGGDSVPTMPRCKMYMIWNSDIIDTCVVFRWWHVRSYTGFVLTLLVIALLGVLYEYLRLCQRKLDFHIIHSLSATKSKGALRGRDRSNSPRVENERNTPNAFGEDNPEEVGLLSGRLLGAKATGLPVPPVYRIVRALVYGLTVFLSFFLMLVFMTYNAYYIFSVVVGATLGHFIFGATISPDVVGDRSLACH